MAQWFLAGMMVFICLQAGALEIRGQWQQGAMLAGKVEPDTEVTINGRKLALSPGGDFVFGLDRDAPAQATLVVSTGEEVQTFHYPVKQRQYQIQRVEGVPQETVTPPLSVLARIQEEAALVARARNRRSDLLDYLTGFSRPLEGPITGVYGSQRFYNGEPRNPHFGLDIAAPKGTLVHAPAPGVVVLAHPDMYFSGGTLIVDHGYGVSSSFIHLSEILVKPGDVIQAGDPIARVGATGRTTGPHLDWRMNWYDVRIDPALVLESFSAHP